MRARTTAQGDGSPAPAAGCDAAPPGPYPSGGLAPSAEAYLPEGRVSLPVLRRAVLRCKGCGIYRCGTRAVFGEGPPEVESGRAAAIMLVGEQPGDHEERQGRPFVGPAGKLLDRALVEAGIDRKRVYVTNAVKHFKFVMRGKRRIHQAPRLPEIAACRPWVEAELALIKPETLVCLGATAARSLLGPEFRLMRDRGRVF
ncbi:MAG TPA: UdgX family uracil-DNA binding protein, partial [Phycisphaerales bacterium]|nr:UdgX family uracil-DNA binding protein [Phycisphaerales bacterium]